MMILNLVTPIASGNLNTDFDLIHLNNCINPKLLSFKKGTASASVQFKADIVALQISKPYIIGNILVKDADITYVPRNLNFNKNKIQLKFTSDKLIVENISIETKKSKIKMHGFAQNFMNLYYNAPDKIVLNWDVYCPTLDLEDIKSFMGTKSRNSVATTKKTNLLKETPLENLTNQSNILLKLKVDKLIYKKFEGTNATGEVHVTKEGLAFNNVTIQHEKGKVNLNGIIKPLINRHQIVFSVLVAAKNLYIKKILYSFDNFWSLIRLLKSIAIKII